MTSSLNIGDTLRLTSDASGYRLSKMYSMIKIPEGTLVRIQEPLIYGGFWASTLKYNKRQGNYLPTKVVVFVKEIPDSPTYNTAFEYRWVKVTNLI